MKKAKTSKNGKYRTSPFYCVYQPIVDIDTGKIFAYEALIRGRGKIRFPEDLYRLSYEEGLTIYLNLECLESAFNILPKLGKGKLLFVNVEPVTMANSFRKGKEGDRLLASIRKYHSRLVFELTEGMKSRDFEHIKRGLSFLKKNGCRYALDDVVGIGWRLGMLLSLRPHFVKIGIELVKGISTSAFQQNLVGQIIELGERTNAVLIAEGVEKKKDLLTLRHMGVRLIQGFYFGRPDQKLKANTLRLDHHKLSGH